jgi:hypothetical protein
MARADGCIASRIPAAHVSFATPAFTRPAGMMLAAFDKRHQINCGVLSGRSGGATWRLVARVPARNPAFGAVAPSAAATGSGQLWARSDNGAKLADVTGDGASEVIISPTWRSAPVHYRIPYTT